MDVDLSSSSSAFAPNILFSLRADRSLLDPTFDRYILRTERLTMTKRKMDAQIRYKLPSDSQWGYQQIRAHTLAPHLFFDHFASSADRQIFFTFLDDLHLVSLSFDRTTNRWADPVQVADIGTSPLASFVFGSEEDALSLSFPESLHFVDSRTAITARGLNAFSVWQTGDRQSAPVQQWREVFNYELPPLHKSHGSSQPTDTAAGATTAVDDGGGVREGGGRVAVYPSLILDARCTPAEGGGDAITSIDVLLLTVEPTTTAQQKNQTEEAKGAAVAERKAQQPSGKSVFRTHLMWVTVQQRQQQQDDTSPEFAVHRIRQILCDGKVEFACFDAPVPIRRLVIFGVGRSPRFVWDSARPLISDAMLQKLKVEEEDKSGGGETMEVVYQQQQEEQDKTTDGASGADDSAPLDNLQPSAAGDAQQQFNAEQLEECDRLPDVEDDVSAFWLDGDSHELVAMTIVNELLFTQKILPEGAPVFATRYDVDTIVWRHDTPSEQGGIVNVSHLFTLNAFGYIQAGHQDKRFLGCSPDGRYATLVNRSNHCFLYFQNSAVPCEHELKNRRTGKRAEHIAKQLVLSMSDLDKEFDPNDSANEFIGFHATSDTLFLLTRCAIYAVEMPK